MKYFTESLQHPKKRLLWLYLLALLLLVGAAFLGILLGSTRLSFGEVLGGLFGGEGSSGSIVRYVRLPRVLASLVCGGALSVSGALTQGVLANPLASPGVIGVNAGAGLAVTLCVAFGILGGWQLSLFAFLGAFLAVMLVSLGAKKWGASRGTVILLGVAMNSLLGAISNAVVTFLPEAGVMSNDFRMGDFSFVTYERLIPAAVVILATVTLSVTFSNELDILRMGEESARGLGLRTGLARLGFLLAAALLAGAAVSVAGLLSFVGLLVPHAVRRMAGGQAKHWLPLCALFGAGFVSLCDTLSRVLTAPYEIPVGIVMAFLGAPFFVFVLIRRKGGHRHGGSN